MNFFIYTYCDASLLSFAFFFFNDTATTEIYTLSLHDALPICRGRPTGSRTSPPRPPDPRARGGAVSTRIPRRVCAALRSRSLYANGGHLVLGRADERIADVVGQPVHLGLGEVKGHPDEAGVDTVGDVRLGLELPAPRHQPRGCAVGEAQVGRVLGRDLEERFLLLLQDAAFPHGHRRRVVVVERAAGGEHEGVLGVGLLDRRLVLDREELPLAARPGRVRSVQERGAGMVGLRAGPL